MRATASALKDPILALESAAVVHGLPVFGEPDIHVHAPGDGRGYRHGRLVVHTSADDRTVVRIEGIRVAGLLDTTLDLLRVLPLALGVAVLDASLRKGLALDEIRATLDVQVNRRGRAQARAAIDRCDPLSESVLESISRVIIDLLGYPAPELQVPFRVRAGWARVDFLWRDAGIIGEADGNAKYFDTATRTDTAIREERRREVELRRAVRGLARWEWIDVIDPERVDSILATEGLRRIRPISPHLWAALANARTRPRRPRPPRKGEPGRGE